MPNQWTSVEICAFAFFFFFLLFTFARSTRMQRQLDMQIRLLRSIAEQMKVTQEDATLDEELDEEEDQDMFGKV